MLYKLTFPKYQNYHVIYCNMFIKNGIPHWVSKIKGEKNEEEVIVMGI